MTGNDQITATRSMFGMLAQPNMSLGWWLAAWCITSGTNLADFLAAPDGDVRSSPLFIVAAIVRVALVVWLAYALIRRMAHCPGPARPTWALLRFFLFSVALGLLLAACAAIAGLAVAADRNPTAFLLATHLLLSLLTLAAIRLYAWQAALAIGDRALGPVGAWRALAGRHGGLAFGYLAILPVALIHSMLTERAVGWDGGLAPLAGLAIVDGAVSAVQLALSCGLSVTAWRMAGRSVEALRPAAAVA